MSSCLMPYLSLISVMLLARLSSALLANPPAPFSYVQSLDFQSYQFAPYTGGGGSLNGTFNVTLTYSDVFPNATKTALVLAGIENQNNFYIGFYVDIFSGTGPTNSIFQINLLGLTSLQYISFFYIILHGTTLSTTHFDVINVVQTNFTLNSSSATLGASPMAKTPQGTVPKTLSGANYQYFIQSFVLDCQSYASCNVEVLKAGTSASNYNYSIQTDGVNTLYEVVFNIFIYKTGTYTVPAFYSYGFVKNEFSILINSVYSDTQGNGFSNGFNGKCLLGSDKYQIETVFFSLKYDMELNTSQITANPFYINSSSTLINLTMFCFLQKFNCSNIDPSCIQCQTQSLTDKTCVDCVNASYASSGQCWPCSTPLVGCTHCQNDTACLECDYPLYFYDAVTSTCLSCLVFLPHCQNCSNISKCDICSAGYGLYNFTSCLACGILITDCQMCTNAANCYTCLGGFYVGSGNSSCQPCSSIPNCATCLNGSYCLTCIQDFHIDVDNYHCLCNPGLYPVTGFCSTLGCISAYKFPPTTQCLACDASKHFQLNNNSCECQVGFSLNNVTCIEICGDGRVFSAYCDDGNLVNGDGCSNQCQVQANYQCFNGTPVTASKCLYVNPLNPTIKDITKTLDSNQMEIILSVNNGLAPLDLTDIAQFMTINIGGATMANFSVGFDPKTALVTISVPYTSSIQGKSVVMNFGYDPSVFKLTTNTLTFDAKGSNLALLYQQPAAGNEQMVISIGYAVSAISVIMMLVSSAFHRIIGLQTFQVTQVVFFVRYMVADSNSGSFQALNSLKYINFYNFFSDYPNIRSLSGPLLRFGMTKAFIFNVLIQMGLLAVMWVLFAFFHRKYMLVKRLNLAQSGNAIDLLKKYKNLSYIFGNFVFTLTASSFLLIAFSYLSSTQPQQQLQTTLPAQIMVLNVAILAYTCLFICKELYSNLKQPRKYNEEEGCYFRYLTFLLVYSQVITYIIVGSGNGLIGKMALAAVQVIYFLGIIYYRPYLIALHNVCIVINQAIILMFTALVILNDFASFLHSIRGYVLIGIELLLTIVNMLACVRLYVHHKYNLKAFQKLKLDAEKAKGNIKEEFKLTDVDNKKKISNTLHKTIFERQKELREKEDNALQRLKTRLKNQFKQKAQEQKGSLLDHQRSPV